MFSLSNFYQHRFSHVTANNNDDKSSLLANIKRRVSFAEALVTHTAGSLTKKDARQSDLYYSEEEIASFQVMRMRWRP